VLFHAAWALVVSRCSGKHDIIFGSVFSGRLQGPAGMDRALGAFINTVPLRVNLQGRTALQLVQQIQQVLLALLPHEQSSLAEAQRCSAVPAGTPLFTALLNYRYTSDDAQRLERFGIREVMSRDQTNYPFCMAVDDSGDALVLKAQTDSSITAIAVLAMMDTALGSILHALETEPGFIALELPVMPDADVNCLREFAKGPTLDWPQTGLIHQLFEDRAQKVPAAVALVHAGVSLSYGELNRRANKLARYLIDGGVKPGKLVALCLERGIEMVVGLLGILKAGGAYLPLEPAYPVERIHYMLEDATPHAVLMQEALRPLLEPSGVPLIAIDSQWDEISQSDDRDIKPEAIGLGSEHLAYVIYTSGSTGRPKGVMVEHRQLVNFLGAMQDGAPLESTDCLLAITTLSFDIAALEVYWPLINGAKLAIASREDASNAYALAEAMQRLDVTVLQATPATWQMLLDSGWAGRPSMRGLCGGEALSVALSEQLNSKTRDLYNLYGPTETTVWSCMRKIDGMTDARKGGQVSIGRPLANMQAHVLNGDMQPVPVGVSGELYVCGTGVARGYLNHPSLTAERFLPDAFSTDAGARMYKTGDLARWRSDGQLEYLGRSDHQVKIRGFRVELGEIEAQMAAFPGLREVVVLAGEDGAGGKRLVAYIAMSPGIEPSGEELRAHLKTMLPDHMIPSAWVRLDKLPQTPNGKLDRRALPSPDDNALIIRAYEAPKGQMEEELAEIWRELLRVERVGRMDNFFDLGGHSLLAVRLLSRLQAWVEDLTLLSIFQHPTVKSLAELMLSGSFAIAEKTNPVLLRGGTLAIPLFVVHEVSGQAFPYVSLARLLKGDMPVYCLHMGNEDKDDFSTTMESLARRHIEAIRQVQPRGPYHLAGWSFGGILAYEIVNQLLQANESVDFFGLIDTQAPSTEKKIYRPVDAGAAAALFVEYLSLLHPSMGDDALTGLRKLPDLQTVLAECWRLGYLEKEITLEAVQSILVTSLLLLNCADHYEPPHLPIKINLYTGSATAAADDFGGWRSLVGDRVKSETIGGTHLSIMRLPYVQDLARSISRELIGLPASGN
jgi:amino acid adenylation domain-containing protein